MTEQEKIQKFKELSLKERTILQIEAAELLGITKGQVSNLIKKGKINADEKNKPFLKSVMEYKPTPGRKRSKMPKKEQK